MEYLYSPMIYRWVRQRGFQPNDASDLVQDVFLKVYKNLGSFELGPGRFRGWLWTITRNVILDVIRERKRKELPISVVDLVELEATPSDAKDSSLPPREIVKRAIRCLREDFDERAQFILEEVVMAGRNANDIAEELGVSRNTVYIVQSRVLKKLRQLLGGTEFGDEAT